MPAGKILHCEVNHIMMDKKSEKMHESITKDENRIVQLQRELDEMRAKAKKKTRDYHTHQVCEMGGTTKKFLIAPDLLTKEDLDELLAYAFSKPDVQARLKAKLRSYGWSEEDEGAAGFTRIGAADMSGGKADEADGGR